VATLVQLTNAVGSVACSSDGHWCAWGTLEGMLQICDLTTRRCLDTGQWKGASCWVCYSPSGHRLTATDEHGNLCFWEGATPIELPWRIPPQDQIKGLAFSADGRTLGAFTSAGAVLLVDPPTSQLQTAFTGFPPPTGPHRADLILSSRGDWFALGDNEGNIRIASARNGHEQARWRAHAGPVTALAASRDDRWLASGAGRADHAVRLWNAPQGQSVAVFEGHTAWISAVAFSPDASLLASASGDQTIRLWDLKERKPTLVLRGHRQEVLALTFTPDGKTMISGSMDGTVRLWSTARPKRPEAPLFLHGCRSLPASIANGAKVLGVDTNAQLIRWDSATLQQNRGAPFGPPKVQILAVSPTQPLLAVGTPEASIQILDGPTGSLQTNLVFNPQATVVTDLMFSGNGRRLIAVKGHYAVQVWECASWKTEACWAVGRSLMTAVEVSPDGRYLVSAGHTVRIWDLQTGNLSMEFEAHPQSTTALAFSPDGKLLATASLDGTVRLWEVGSWGEVGILRGHLQGIRAMAFSIDGRRLATGSVDREAVKLWNLETRNAVLNLPLSGRSITGLRFAPDNTGLWALTAESGACVWRTPTWEQIAAAEASVVSRK
jgi:WD40 repeat protein